MSESIGENGADRTQAANQFHAVVDTAPAALRNRLGSMNTERIVAVAARFHRGHPGTPHDAAKLTLRVLARRWEALGSTAAAQTTSRTAP